LLSRGEKLLVHRRGLSDEVCGLMAGYLLWMGMVPDESQVLVVVEKMTQRPIGSVGRRIVSAAAALPSPEVLLATTSAPDTEADPDTEAGTVSDAAPDTEEA